MFRAKIQFGLLPQLRGQLMDAGNGIVNLRDRGEWADAQTNGPTGGETSQPAVSSRSAVQPGARLNTERVIQDRNDLVRSKAVHVE